MKSLPGMNNNFTAAMVRTAVFAAAILASSMLCGSDGVYTESFDTTAYMDSAKTDAHWNYMQSRAELQKVSRFAQTIDLVNWGGGILAADYGGGKWMIGDRKSTRLNSSHH